MALISKPALSHEFWISPENYTVNLGESIVADIRVGSDFSGSSHSFFPNRFTRFDLVEAGKIRPVTGRLGDRPALNMVAETAGLVVVVHETKDDRLTYTDWEQFTNFVNHKAFAGVLDSHRARGFPDHGFTETYRRFAKSLVAVGHGKGADSAVGLRTEIIALTNPYTDDLAGGLPVQVLFEGAPRVNIQVEVFSKIDNALIEKAFYRTDDAGVAVIAVNPGTEYLVDAVVMLPLENQDHTAGPVWTSLWASLTFKTPD